MQRVEFHCHTNASQDSLVKPRDLIQRCRKIGLDKVVITDHNTISGALQAQELAPDLVVVGEEIQTDKGELLAAFVTEEIPRGLPAREAIERLRKQGAFISVSHPFDTLRSGAWGFDALEQIAPFVDAIEIFNSRCLFDSFNIEAREFAETKSLAGTVGSDAHSLWELGKASMFLNDFSDADSFRHAFAEVTFRVKRSGLLARMGSRYAVLVNQFSSR